MLDPGMPLTLWSMNVGRHDVLTRAEAVAPGGFTDMSIYAGDLAILERDGGTVGALRRELDAREVPISCVDAYFGWYPGHDPARIPEELRPFMFATADETLRWAHELEAPFITLLGPFFHDDVEAPFEEQVERLGAFADRAAELGLRPHIEPVPTSKVPTLGAALALLEAVDRPNLGLLVDTYNLTRSGMRPEELDDVPLERIFSIQVADAPAIQRGATYFEEATSLRELPGEGDLPIVEILARIASKGPLPPTGPEIANPAFEALSADEVSRRVAAATRGVLGEAAARSTSGPG